MFWYACGAIAAPYVASVLMERFGPPALFAMIAVGHVLLIVFGTIRMWARPTKARTNYVYTPRTTFMLGRLLRSSREKD